jgi:trehalose-phosphatase
VTGSPAPLGDHLHVVVDGLQASDGLLVALDYDGTLAPLTAHPEEATIPPATQAAISALDAHRHVVVAVVSGRALADLRGRVESTAYAGNHGFELHCDGETTVAPGAETAREAVRTACDALEGRLREVDGAFVERKGVTATVHYRQAEAAAIADIERAVRTVSARYETLRVTGGKAVLELRPTLDWDKGDALTWLAERHIPAGERWFTLYLGDDRTDEDAFAVLGEGGLGVKVGGDGPTEATHYVADPAAVCDLLGWLDAYGVAFLDRDE